MAFCTQLEWDSGFPFERYEEMAGRAGSHDPLPQGCLVRVVGRKDSGALHPGGVGIVGRRERFGERSAVCRRNSECRCLRDRPLSRPSF